MKAGNQELWSCVDLRPFDLTKKDLGVSDYLAKSKATGIIFLNFYVDFIHTQGEVVDDTTLHAMCTANRGMPWSQTWTRKDFLRLVKEIQTHGVAVYLGFLAATRSDRWDEETPWVKDHPRLYQTTRNGERLWGHSINPLKHIAPGTLYEDLFVRDLAKTLDLYGFDGVCLGDGMLGLRGPRETLEDTDFSDDMLAQFSTAMNIELPAHDPAQHILTAHRREWAEFWCRRWEEFVGKLGSMTGAKGVGLMALDAWSRHPVDLYWDFGIDYARLGRKGLERVMVQAREANKWRKHQEGPYAVEGAMIGTFLSHKLHAPNVTFCWAMATVNAPELWDAILDLPNVLEREAMAYLTLSFFDGDQWKAVVDGVCLIWGNMARDEDWTWCHRLWNTAYDIVDSVEYPIGGILVHGNELKMRSLPSALGILIDEGYALHGACLPEAVPALQKQRLSHIDLVHPEVALNWFLQSQITEEGRVSSDSYLPTSAIEASHGRVRGWKTPNHTFVVAVENQDNLFYRHTTVSIPEEVVKIICHPPREHYLVTQSEQGKSFSVSVPPDGVLVCTANHRQK